MRTKMAGRHILCIQTPTRGGVLLKDQRDPTRSLGATLQGTTIHVHWRDGFTYDEAEQALSVWWPEADEIFEVQDVQK